MRDDRMWLFVGLAGACLAVLILARWHPQAVLHLIARLAG